VVTVCHDREVTITRLLVVEDQRDLGRVLKRVFCSNGYEVELATCCAEALAFDDVADCAVLDIDLPDGSGIGLASDLLAKERARCVVFYSAQADASIQNQASLLGPFVSKGSDINELLRMVQHSIQRQRALAAGSGTFPRSGTEADAEARHAHK
jgi:DNA-binding response OmpR family regulator